ncbi:MAG TPA: hypothetical protein VIF82_12460 [Burkholderiaceae bacterium]|jgi:hypothetical protein
MHSKFEQGALSLVGVAIFSAVLAAVAIATLYSWRYERNVFAEGWTKFSGLFQQQTQRVAQSVGSPASSAIYQCTVNGKVLYSNVACDVKDVASKKVDVQDTHGFEAPKLPLEASSVENNRPALQDKIIDRALQSH